MTIRHRPLLLALLFGACDGSPASPAADTDAPEQPANAPEDSDAEDSEADPFAAQPLDMAALERLDAAVTSFVQEVAALDHAPVQEAVRGFLEREGPNCPNYVNLPEGPAWTGDCTTAQGVRFYGNFLHRIHLWPEYSQTEVLPLLTNAWAARLTDDFQSTAEPVIKHEAYRITGSVEAGSVVVSLSGDYWDLRFEYGDVVVEQLLLAGQISDPRQNDNWVGRGIVPNLERIRFTGTGDARGIVINGALSGLSDEAATAWAYDLELATSAADDACPSEPTGNLAVRETDGSWFDLIYDGDAGGDCDGCAQVMRADTAVGTLCTDFSPLLDPPTGATP